MLSTAARMPSVSAASQQSWVYQSRWLQGARGTLGAQEPESWKTWVMSQQLGRGQPKTADRKCWRETWGVSPTTWIAMDSCSLQSQTLYWSEVPKLILSHITQKQKAQLLSTWPLFVHSGDMGDDLFSVPSSLTTSLQSIWHGCSEPVLSQTIPFWQENWILSKSHKVKHEWLFPARLVFSSIFFPQDHFGWHCSH